MSRNPIPVPAGVFALRAFVVLNALTLTGAIYTGHDALWALSIFFSLAILAAQREDVSATGTPRVAADAATLSSTKGRALLAHFSPHLSKPLSPMPQQQARVAKSATRSEKNPVMLTREDYNALQPLAAGASPTDEMTLAHELHRAIIVKREALPLHTVRLASHVTVKDLDTAREMSFSIVMPAAADMRQNKISILTPMGTALIGFRAGEVVEWKVPAGIKRFKILEVMNNQAAA